MPRDNVISVYFSADEKKHIQAEANEAGESLSSYLYKLIQEQRRREGVDRAATELNAEERIEALIAEGTENLEEIAEDIRRQNQRIVNMLEDADTDEDIDDQDGDGTGGSNSTHDS